MQSQKLRISQSSIEIDDILSDFQKPEQPPTQQKAPALETQKVQ